MAKVILPLGSFGARGKIGNSFVYFPWKGIACVREYLIPANPRTPDQQTQRGYFKTAVDEYHNAGYNSLDLTAWRLLASQSPKPITYFNACIQQTVKAYVAGLTWINLHGGNIQNLTSTSFDFRINQAEGHTAILYWGVNPGYMPNEVSGIYSPSSEEWQFSLTGLQPSTKIYFYVKSTDGSDGTRTGIYLQKTPAT